MNTSTEKSTTTGQNVTIRRVVTNTTGLSSELVTSKRWCIFKLDRPRRIGQHMTKLPINAVTGRMAKSNDPASWSDFKTALAGYKKFDASGLGFFLGDGWCCLDVDDQSEQLREFMSDPSDSSNLICQLLQATSHSYTEVSQSGTGIHIIFKGRKPQDSASRKGKYEMYDRTRFIALTGNTIRGCTNVKTLSRDQVEQLAEMTVGKKEVGEPVSNQQKTPPAQYPRTQTTTKVGYGLSEQTIINRMRNNPRQGTKLSRLLDGDISLYNNDHSSADIALCNALAFWTNHDPRKMDNIFRQSGLMRGKWDEPHNSKGETYGQMTINDAIQHTPRGYSYDY